MLERFKNFFKKFFKKQENKSIIEVQKIRKYKTDKGTVHSYLEIYDEILSQYTNPSILEIGVEGGESLRLWKEAFPKAVVHGLDNDIRSKKIIPGCEIFIEDLATWTPPRKYDIIIDDASHKLRDQQTAFYRFFEKYCRGYYIIEDVQNMANARMLMSMDSTKANLYDLREKKNREDDIMVIFKK